MSQSSHPTLINLPQPPSRPDTPSEAPGTPTSTTTSLSALSTTAIKDGHRGQAHHATNAHRGHQHTLSTNSLEAERADRISRLTGLSGVSALRNATSFSPHPSNNAGFVSYQPSPYPHSSPHQPPNHGQQQTTPTSTGFPHMMNGVNMLNPQPLTPAYFDAAGQPVAATKMSTVGSASATESIAGRTTGGATSTTGEDEEDEPFYDGSSTRRDPDDEEQTEIEMDSASGGGYDDDVMMLAAQDEDETRSGFDEDRMLSDDDGSASLVGFGEGAGSTVSGPIYHRRQPQLERNNSGLSESRLQQPPRLPEREKGGDTPTSQSAAQERREALMVDGIALDSGIDDVFVDTTTRGPVPLIPTAIPSQANISAIRETQQPGSHQQAQQHRRSLTTPRETAERIIRERLDEGESRVPATGPTLGRATAAQGGQRLGQFYFEEGRR